MATIACEFCYAEGMNKRLGTGLPFKPGHRKDIEIFLDEEMLTAPLRWKKPRRIFVCSMTDAFAEFVTDEMLDKMFAVMALCPQHTFQVLTKRPGRMRGYFSHPDRGNRGHFIVCGPMSDLVPDDISDRANHAMLQNKPLPNVWLGVSCERQQEADERIPHLLQTPAAVRFVSAEPLLGPIDLRRIRPKPFPIDALTGGWGVPRNDDGHHKQEDRLHWVIVGGESGRNARPMHPDWARKLRDDCSAAGVPFFMKQWGEWHPSEWDETADQNAVNVNHALHQVFAPMCRLSGWQAITRVGKKAAGRLLDGREWNEFPGGGR